MVTTTGLAEMSILKTALPEGSPTEISTTKVGSTQVRFGHMNVTQVSSTQVNSQGGTNFGATQVNSTQVTTTQSVATTIRDANFSEIPLSSSISLQQLFNFNPSSSHTSPSEFLYDINSTAQTLWNSLLKPSTPFDINLQIADLPKGQLAEAQITKYETSFTLCLSNKNLV